MTSADATNSKSSNGESSVSSSFENLMASSQGVMTKRIDLALLEGQEILARSLQRAALIGAGTALAAMAWFAMAGAFVLLVIPDGAPILRLVAFGLLNGAGAVGLVSFAIRSSRPLTRVRSNGNEPTRQPEPVAAEGTK